MQNTIALTTHILDMDEDGRVWAVFFLSASSYVFIWKLTWVRCPGSSFILYCKILRHVVMNVINYSSDGRQAASISLLLCPPSCFAKAVSTQVRSCLPLSPTVPTSSSLLGSKWAVELPAEVLRQQRMVLSPLERILSPLYGHLPSTPHAETTDRSIT